MASVYCLECKKLIRNVTLKEKVDGHMTINDKDSCHHCGSKQFAVRMNTADTVSGVAIITNTTI